jgi:hypothetical protein
VEALAPYLNQLTPWGLTIGQTAVVVGFVVGLLVLVLVLRTVFRVTGMLLRVGCGIAFLLSCGCIATFIFINLRR